MTTATVHVLVCPAWDDRGADDDPVFEVRGDDEREVDERAQELAAEYGSCAVVRRPAEVALATGAARPVVRHYSNGYDCPWCSSPVPDGSPGCANPACLAQPGADLDTVRRALERLVAEDAQRAEAAQRAEWGRQYLADQREERQTRWGVVAAEADRLGACRLCLAHSPWEHGDPRFVRHRRADYHDRADERTPAR